MSEQIGESLKTLLKTGVFFYDTLILPVLTTKKIAIV